MGIENTYFCQHFTWRWTRRTTYSLPFFFYFKGTELWFGNLYSALLYCRTTGQITGYGSHHSLKPPHCNQPDCCCQMQEHLLCRNNKKICMPTPGTYVKCYLLYCRTADLVKTEVKKKKEITIIFAMLNMGKIPLYIFFLCADTGRLFFTLAFLSRPRL